MTKEEFLSWCRTSALPKSFFDHGERFIKMLEAHDPELARLERAVMEASRRSDEYIRARLR